MSFSLRIHSAGRSPKSQLAPSQLRFFWYIVQYLSHTFFLVGYATFFCDLGKAVTYICNIFFFVLLFAEVPM